MARQHSFCIEDMMKSIVTYFGVLLFAAVMLTGRALNGAETPADISGTWTVSVTGAAGRATQTITIQQQEEAITGKFKGPRQSGTLTGTVKGSQVAFHVKAHVPIDYTGTADGDSMKGTLVGGKKSGEWTATRVK
jgi:hypothetical protein